MTTISMGPFSSSQTVNVYRVKDRRDPENPQKTQGLMDADPPK